MWFQIAVWTGMGLAFLFIILYAIALVKEDLKLRNISYIIGAVAATVTFGAVLFRI